MRKDLLNLPEQISEEQFSVLAEQVLTQSILEFRKELLRKEIDKALIERNKEEFLRLTDELKSLSNN